MTVDEILDRFDLTDETHEGYLALCPAHDDADPSLVLFVKPDGSVVPHCRAGCKPAVIRKAVGLSAADMRKATGLSERHVIAMEPEAVTDEERREGAIMLSLAVTNLVGPHPGPLRLHKGAMDFLHRRYGIESLAWDEAHALGLGVDRPDGSYLVVAGRDPDGRVTFMQGRDLTGKRRVRWTGLANPDDGRRRWYAHGFVGPFRGVGPLIVCEGPTDAIAASVAGYDAVAVTGAAKPARLAETPEWFTDRDLVIAGDPDAAGREFTKGVARALQQYARSIESA